MANEDVEFLPAGYMAMRRGKRGGFDIDPVFLILSHYYQCIKAATHDLYDGYWTARTHNVGAATISQTKYYVQGTKQQFRNSVKALILVLAPHASQKYKDVFDAMLEDEKEVQKPKSIETWSWEGFALCCECLHELDYLAKEAYTE